MDQNEGAGVNSLKRMRLDQLDVAQFPVMSLIININFTKSNQATKSQIYCLTWDSETDFVDIGLYL